MGLYHVKCSSCGNPYVWFSGGAPPAVFSLCTQCKPKEAMTLERAIHIVQKNINAHGLDIWLLRDAEAVVLDELRRLQEASK